MKTTMKRVALSLVFLVLFDVSFFLIVSEPSDSQWITLGFVHGAYALLLFLAYAVSKGRDGAVIAYPGVALATQYFIIEVAVGVIYLFIKDASTTWTIIPQMILAGVYLALIVTNSLANEKIIANTAVDRARVDYVRQSVAALQRIRLGVTDAELSRRLESLEDALRYAQVASSALVADTEARIVALIAQLEDAAKDADTDRVLRLCREIEALVSSRNSILAVRAR